MSQPTGVPSLDAIPMCAVMCEWTYREMSPLTRTGLTPPPGGSRRDGLPLVNSRGAERVGGPYAVRDAPVRETRPTGTPEARGRVGSSAVAASCGDVDGCG